MSGVQIKIILMSFLNYVEKGEIFLGKIKQWFVQLSTIEEKNITC